MPHHPFSLPKAERIKSRKLAQELFAGRQSKSAIAFPLRAVYMLKSRESDAEPQAMVLVSVSKRRFKHAVKRNRVKRQVREAYRTRKQILLDGMAARPDETVVVAFIWIDDALHTSATVARSMRKLLDRIVEGL